MSRRLLNRFAGTMALAGALHLAGCASVPGITDHREARAISDQGLALMNEGDDAGAIRLFSRVIAYNGGDVEDFTRRATAYAALNQHDAAVKDLDRALELGPGRWRTHLLRAVANQKRGHYDDAVHDLDLAIALKPDEVELVRRRGYLRLVTGRFDEALADYEHLARLIPASPTGPFGRGVSLYLGGNWRAAAAEFERQLTATPKDGVAALWMVKASLRNRTPMVWEQFADRAGPEPEWTMIRALLTEVSAEDIAREIGAMSKSEPGRRSVGPCERALFLGTWSQIKRRDEDARAKLESARQACPADSIEGAEARAELVRVTRASR